MTLRICQILFKPLVEMDEKGQLKGLLSPIADSFAREIGTVFHNITRTPSDKLGDMNPETRMFDGCLGRIQRNESDIQSPFIAFPVLAPGLEQGYVVQTSKTVILSAYNNTEIPTNTDVMDAFNSLSRPLWSLTALTVFVLTLLTFVAIQTNLLLVRQFKPSRNRRVRESKWQSKRRSMRQAAVVAAGNVMKQHTSYQYNDRRLSAKIIIFVFAMFTFLIHYYFCAMIKTEMVVQKKPETISSYDEILQKDVRPVWVSQLSAHWDFASAQSDTREGKLWQQATRIGLDKCFIESESDVRQVFPSVVQQEAVLIGPSYLERPLITNICAAIKAAGVLMDINIWTKADPSSKEKLTGVMITSAMPQEHVKKLNRVTQAIFEHSLAQKTLKKLEFSYFPDVGSRAVHDCLSNMIIFPDQILTPVTLSHYDRLFVVSALLVIVAVAVLVFEIIPVVKFLCPSTIRT